MSTENSSPKVRAATPPGKNFHAHGGTVHPPRIRGTAAPAGTEANIVSPDKVKVRSRPAAAAAIALLILLNLFLGLTAIAQTTNAPVLRGSTTVFTNRLWYVLDSANHVTNTLWWTNSTGVFGDTNAVFIYTNASTHRWEWKSNSTVLATNIYKSGPGSWWTLGGGHYGVTYFPVTPAAPSIPGGTGSNTTNPPSSIPPNYVYVVGNQLFIDTTTRQLYGPDTNFFKVNSDLMVNPSGFAPIFYAGLTNYTDTNYVVFSGSGLAAAGINAGVWRLVPGSWDVENAFGTYTNGGQGFYFDVVDNFAAIITNAAHHTTSDYLAVGAGSEWYDGSMNQLNGVLETFGPVVTSIYPSADASLIQVNSRTATNRPDGTALNDLPTSNSISSAVASVVHNPIKFFPFLRTQATNQARVYPFLTATNVGAQTFGSKTHTNMSWVQTGGFWRVRQNDPIVRAKFYYGESTNDLVTFKIKVWRLTTDFTSFVTQQNWTNVYSTTNLARRITGSAMNDLAIDLGGSTTDFDMIGVFASWTTTNHSPFMQTNDTWHPDWSFLPQRAASKVIFDTNEITGSFNWLGLPSDPYGYSTSAVVFELYADKSPHVIFEGNSTTGPGGSPPDAVSWYEYAFATNSGLKCQANGVGGGNVGGTTWKDLLVRLQRDVLDNHPRVVVCTDGINNMFSPNGFPEAMTNVWRQLTNAGIRVIEVAMFPQAGYASQTNQWIWNEWMRTNAPIYGVQYVDLSTNIGVFNPTGPAGNYWNPKSGTLSDTVHQNRTGGLAAGNWLAEFLGLTPTTKATAEALSTLSGY